MGHGQITHLILNKLYNVLYQINSCKLCVCIYIYEASKDHARGMSSSIGSYHKRPLKPEGETSTKVPLHVLTSHFIYYIVQKSPSLPPLLCMYIHK